VLCLEFHKLRLIEAWSGFHRNIIDQAIDQWRFCLNACVMPKESTLDTCYDVLFHSCQQIVFTF